ncbi:hypothetical protein ANN_18396 [Periplaneta americana]|uniref:Uncharacterized protein n=1 Tax=Periplaneta americana TaxID=6978 RepID=A0ABQ8SNM5_PERAM|nr:hypothetical protein ANN_18396 [Periplaneta americana]
MFAVYGEHSMSCSRVLEWHKRFREGRVSLEDDARPGQAHGAITLLLLLRLMVLYGEIDGSLWKNFVV